MGRGSTSQKQRIKRTGRREQGKFGREVGQESADPTVSARDQGEIAITTAVPAERYVNIRRSSFHLVTIGDHHQKTRGWKIQFRIAFNVEGILYEVDIVEKLDGPIGNKTALITRDEGVHPAYPAKPASRV